MKNLIIVALLFFIVTPGCKMGIELPTLPSLKDVGEWLIDLSENDRSLSDKAKSVTNTLIDIVSSTFGDTQNRTSPYPIDILEPLVNELTVIITPLEEDYFRHQFVNEEYTFGGLPNAIRDFTAMQTRPELTIETVVSDVVELVEEKANVQLQASLFDLEPTVTSVNFPISEIGLPTMTIPEVNISELTTDTINSLAKNLF